MLSLYGVRRPCYPYKGEHQHQHRTVALADGATASPAVHPVTTHKSDQSGGISQRLVKQRGSQRAGERKAPLHAVASASDWQFGRSWVGDGTVESLTLERCAMGHGPAAGADEPLV